MTAEPVLTTHDPSAVAAGAPQSETELPVSILLVVAAVATAALAQGGYYRTGQWVVAGLVAMAAMAGRAPGSLASAAGQPLVRACGALAAWSMVSAVLAGQWSSGLSTVLLLAGSVIVVMTCAGLDAGQRDQVGTAVVVLGVVVAVTGWVGVAWHRQPWALVDQGLWRAATTVTYANAAAGFLAVVALLSLARSSGRPSSPWSAAANCVLLTGLGATLSRGGLFAFLVGTLVLGRLLGVSTFVRTTAAPAVGALVALVGLWPSIPASSPARPPLAVGVLAVGLLVAVGTTRLPSRRLLIGALAGVPLLVILASGPVSEATESIAAARFDVASSDRAGEARSALRLAARHPVAGVGPGNAELSWERSDGALLVARYAHNEYLQILAELGVIGLMLLLALMAVVVRTVQRSSLARESRPLWAGAAAALMALAVQGLFDFGWHLPAIGLTGAVLVGIATTSERKEQR